MQYPLDWILWSVNLLVPNPSASSEEDRILGDLSWTSSIISDQLSFFTERQERKKAQRQGQGRSLLRHSGRKAELLCLQLPMGALRWILRSPACVPSMLRHASASHACRGIEEEPPIGRQRWGFKPPGTMTKTGQTGRPVFACRT